MSAPSQPSVEPAPRAGPPEEGWGVATALLYYLLSGCVVMLGVYLGRGFVSGHPGDAFVRSLLRFDGEWYEEIVVLGYSYKPDVRSSVAFFPAYPCGARALQWLTGLPADWSLVVFANLCLAGAFVLLNAYVRLRYPESAGAVAPAALLAFGLFPTTFWFRMAYSEGLFLLLTILTFYLMERKAPLVLIALTVGLTTAVRPTGVCLLAPLALHVWQRARGVGAAVLASAGLLPLACWGLVAYSYFQAVQFNAPFAFVEVQSAWYDRSPVPWEDQFLDLLIGEPVWSVFDPASACYWGRSVRPGQAILSMHVANPLFFLLAVGLVGLGAWKGWLSPTELALATPLLVIPYLTRAHEMCMQSEARFAAAVFPAYLVLGRLLGRAPPYVLVGAAGLSGTLLGVYTALFTAKYPFI